MGSFFSTADGHGGEYDYSRPLPEPQEHIARPMSKEALAAIQRYVDRSNSGLRPYTREEIVAGRIRTLVHRAIKHYNSNNKGAEFEYPDQSTTEMKAACVGFRGTFWYHLAFSARPRDATERQHFFAELYFDRRSRQLAVETCIILEKPLCQFSNGCAFCCPDESNILHPSKAEFVCGKEGHEKEFFRVRDMLVRPFNSCVELLYRCDLQWLDPTKTALARRLLSDNGVFEDAFL